MSREMADEVRNFMLSIVARIQVHADRIDILLKPISLVRWLGRTDGHVEPTAATRCDTDGLSFPKITSGRIDDVARPRPEWLLWRQTVGLLDATARLSVMPNACALDCNTPHTKQEFAAGAAR